MDIGGIRPRPAAGSLRARSGGGARRAGRIALVFALSVTLFVVGGLGLWLANQLCDLVQVRSSPEGTAVRVHVSKL